MAGIGKAVPEFQDLLPVMAEKLGGEGLMRELCNGFQLLMDKEKGVITVESLKSNAAVLGLQDLRHDELVSMVEEGDTDGDGALSEMEFCVLMFRLSPELMEESQLLLEEFLQEELKSDTFY
ncbi:Calcium-binding protein PBP1 [Hibiscus syriacus]|uniref:Calcium-binding protein PBP1 n=1 Tax=Hibiscus syriacus TaxID=106335 RepID=A0A6A3CZD9_HIBSY|nr:calcium-binding protein PBP1-like [Hibiscus syriacus]KAE8733867.1 Calcium-binding protein PBP1 [Hibiscus syriacus]